MKLCRKVVAFVLSLVTVFTLPLSAGALDKDAVGTFFHKGFYNTAETLVEGLLGAIASLFPAQRNWKAPDDQIGYIVPDNNYMPMIAPESNSIELVSLGKQTASLLMEGYQSLIGHGVS